MPRMMNRRGTNFTPYGHAKLRQEGYKDWHIALLEDISAQTAAQGRPRIGYLLSGLERARKQQLRAARRQRWSKFWGDR